jgi:hypothetical protein
MAAVQANGAALWTGRRASVAQNSGRGRSTAVRAAGGGVAESQHPRALRATGGGETAARLKKRRAGVAFATDRLYGSCAAPGVTVTCDPML